MARAPSFCYFFSMSLRHEILRLTTAAFETAQRESMLPAGEIGKVVIERPQNPEHGDYACSTPLRLARVMRMDPFQIAGIVSSYFCTDGAVASASAARPGFINLSMSPQWLADRVPEILVSKEGTITSEIRGGSRVQVEYVSGNPTGPLHVGHIRGAVYGSALANVLRETGYDVQTEYYINNYGNQAEQFAASLHACYLQLFGQNAEVPEDGYHGSYIKDLASEIKNEAGAEYLDGGAEEIGVTGMRRMLSSITRDLKSLGIEFDNWYSELSLHTSGKYQKVIQLLDAGGFLEDRDGARWFKASELGEDKDNVVVRSNGSPTYFASDIAYHYDKFTEGGYDRVIDIWGADHHGHVPRIKAGVQAIGISPEKLEILITQIVTLKRDGESVRVSKRTGEMITLEEVVDEVGSDACRFLFLMRSLDSQMDFDLELAKQQTVENPVYYVQYAHARIASILRLAAERGIDYGTGEVSLLTHPAESALIKKMLQLPELLELMARNLAPHHLPHYSMDLATSFHTFYQQCRVVSSDPLDKEITAARLKLVEAAKMVLSKCLGLMIVSAPEEM